MMTRAILRIGLALATLLAAPVCIAQTRDVDAAAFSAEMAARISKAAGRELVVSAPLTLRVKGAKSDDGTLFLDRIYTFCTHNSAEDCEISNANFVESTAESFGALPPVSADRLRVVVRSSDYCAQIAALDTKGKPRPLSKPFAEGLCIALMADYPRSRRSVSASDVGLLKLAPDAAWRLATTQTLKDAPRIGDIPADGSAMFLEGGDYVPSALLDLDGWRALAARTHGDLIMAVPSDTLVVVYADVKAEEIPRLRDIVQKEEESAERGISPFVYRWNGNGWSVVR